jgi:hypothetical protein
MLQQVYKRPDLHSTAVIPGVAQFIHQHFLLILIGAYLSAGVLPQFGLWLGNIEFAQVHCPDSSTVKVTISLRWCLQEPR